MSENETYSMFCLVTTCLFFVFKVQIMGILVINPLAFQEEHYVLLPTFKYISYVALSKLNIAASVKFDSFTFEVAIHQWQSQSWK